MKGRPKTIMNIFNLGLFLMKNASHLKNAATHEVFFFTHCTPTHIQAEDTTSVHHGIMCSQHTFLPDIAMILKVPEAHSLPKPENGPGGPFLFLTTVPQMVEHFM